jgi:hypothetical protein
MNWFKSFWKALNTPQVREESDTGKAMVELNNFTPRATQVLALARKEAARFNHNFVGTEHLLLGLIALGQGTAVTVLGKLGLNPDLVRNEVERQVGIGPDQKVFGNIPFTPRVKKVLALAGKEAKALNHTYVGTEHILLGLLREGDGVAARVLKNFDVDIDQTRQEILKELDPNFRGAVRSTVEYVVTEETEKPKPPRDAIDTGKHYDVYCSEGNKGIVVYRSALFKGRKKLFPVDRDALFSEFLELEQADGQTLFVPGTSVIKFCEPGVKPGAEPV